jgi:hypothetical protein
MSRFVLLHNVRLDTTTRINWYSVLGRPHPYRFGVRAAVRRGLSPGCRTTSPASYPAANVGETRQCFTQFACMSLIEVNLVFTAVEGERNRFASLRPINIIFKQNDCLFCHEIRLAAY